MGHFFQWLRGRGLDGVKLIVGDKCMGMLEAVGEVFPDAKYQRCTVHFYRNVFSVVPKSKIKIVAKMPKAIHAQESKKASREKAKAVVAELRAMKLKEAAKKVEDGIEETLTYCDFPSEHWTRIRTNNVIERLNREMRRRTRVMGTFPGRNSALCWAVPSSATWRAPSEATRNTWIRSTWRRLWMTPSLLADFIQQEPANNFAHKS